MEIDTRSLKWNLSIYIKYTLWPEMSSRILAYNCACGSQTIVAKCLSTCLLLCTHTVECYKKKEAVKMNEPIFIHPRNNCMCLLCSTSVLSARIQQWTQNPIMEWCASVKFKFSIYWHTIMFNIYCELKKLKEQNRMHF